MLIELHESERKFMYSAKDIFACLIQEVNAGRSVAWCVVVEATGSTPQSPGSMMVVLENAEIRGTVGGSCVEGAVRNRAFDLVKSGGTALIEVDLDLETLEDEGLICGGAMKIAIQGVPGPSEAKPFQQALEKLMKGDNAELPIAVQHEGKDVRYHLRLEAEPVLLIAGAGHVGAELARLASNLEFKVVALDNRADFANSSRFPPPMEVRVGEIPELLKAWPIDHSTYIVIVTRGHKYDQAALDAVIRSEAKYIGMIGSRRKVKIIFDSLAETGIKQELLSRVHSPIGLPINSVTVQEIAVSIAAELIKTRRTEKFEPVEGPL